MANDLGRVASQPGSREPDQQAVPALTGFDPSREQEIRLRAIEEVIGWIEEPSFREIRGILAKRKRDREDAALRGKTIREERAELVGMIRARLNNESGTMIRTLREIRDGEFGCRGGIGHYELMDAAILADRKLITLTATMAWGAGSYNTIPAETVWTAAIADKGLRVLDAVECDSDEHRNGEDGDSRLSGEAMPARAEGIAQTGDHPHD